MRPLLIIFYLALIGLGVTTLQETTGPLLPAIFFLILALPAGVFGTYLATLRRIHWLSMWSADSLAVRWFSGAWLRLTVGFLMAFVAAALLSIRFSVAGRMDLALVAFCVLVVSLFVSVPGKWLLGQFKPLYRHGSSLFWIAVIAAVLMSFLDPAARFMAGAYDSYSTIGDAIDSVSQRGNWLGTSAISQLVSGFGSSWVGLERFVLGQLVSDPGSGTWFALVFAGLVRFPLYFAVSLTVCAFALPQSEYKRILQPSKSDEVVGHLSSKRVAMASASATIVVLFIYLPVIAMLESALVNRPAMTNPEVAVIHTVEMIGDRYHTVGTVEEINHLAVSMLDDHSEVMDPIENALTGGFSVMRANVDPYLDWYYSLPGEWTRVARLLSGNFEDYLSGKLSESLGSGEPFANFEQEFTEALQRETRKVEDFRERANALLETRRIEVSSEDEIAVVARADRETLLSLPVHSGLTTIEQRLGVTAATSGISGVVAAAATRQVLMRAAARGTLRTAASAITRLATVRAASAGSGGAMGGVIGGVIGSVVPGIGTAIGAGIGGAIGGIAVGVGAEFLILKLEELWSRQAHRQELLSAIDETEAEVRRKFGLDPSSENSEPESILFRKPQTANRKP